MCVALIAKQSHLSKLMAKLRVFFIADLPYS